MTSNTNTTAFTPLGSARGDNTAFTPLGSPRGDAVHFPDESPQAHAIRARLAAGDHAFVHDTGNGYVVTDPPIAGSGPSTSSLAEVHHG